MARSHCHHKVNTGHHSGYLPPSDSADYPPSGQTIAYEKYQYGPEISDFSPTIKQITMEDVSWHITNGAGVSSPSEYLGFYISGVHAPGWGPTLDNGNSTQLSQRMITVDTSKMLDPKFSNSSIPSYIKPRTNAEAVWVPVADRGIVVLIGGVTYPEKLYSGGLSEDQEKESRDNDPVFMETVSIYDIADNKWWDPSPPLPYPNELAMLTITQVLAKHDRRRPTPALLILLRVREFSGRLLTEHLHLWRVRRRDPEKHDLGRRIRALTAFIRMDQALRRRQRE